MAEQFYDRINEYTAVKITLASPNDIRSWSFGEVKKPETINYRTYRPEKDGLFCERIFGPERDYECACGKYKGTKFKGIICDRCGVKVTHSRVRRKRMGHINLAAPIVHIWFFKSSPSRLGNLMGMKTSDLEKIIYFQDYVVVDPGDTPLKEKQVLTEDEYRKTVEEYGSSFTAMMGAESVKELLVRLDLNKLSEELRTNLKETRSKQKIKELSKRLKIVEQIRGSENKAEWMVMDVIPVIPPDLRPLVLLESGNFATSDLNDLYRRIINRNNRLKKLMDLNAPEVIIRNEKRMLQQSVDALFDNGRCRRPVLGSSNRPLKSLTDMIKGKQGRFRENLLGKRVDYSARSVIVVGPELKLNQCGLPKKIALELFQPFIIRKLKEHGLADTIKSAKKMLERRDPEVWDILEEVIYQHPVLLNRAPTLHRMGIQAFEPVLVEGNAIRVHPLVCTGFNADFDGDQMAVHLPLSVEAQAEAHVLMLSTHNIFSPSNGNPIISPSQDIVLGVYYITSMPVDGVVDETKIKRFKDPTEALLAYDLKRVGVLEPIMVRLEPGRFTQIVKDQKAQPEAMPESNRIVTTVGRLMFNDILGQGMPYYNCALGKKGAARVIDDTYAYLNRPATIDLLDKLKDIGFKRSTLAGLSFGITDLRIPAAKQSIIDATQKRVDRVEKAFQAGALTDRERYNQLLDLWTHCREEVTKELLKELKTDRRDEQGNEVKVDSKEGKLYMNPVWLMADSGARGNVSQIQQLAGMRGLMSKPSGEIIETPIRANAREGMTVLEYFSSTHGARKGLADTALKTADSGYLTRKLADVAQNVFIAMDDCGTKNGVTKRATYKGEEIDVPLRESIVGRTARETIRNPITDQLIVAENKVVDEDAARAIENLGIDSVMVRSPLTCEAGAGMCAKCYGQDLSTGILVEEGLAVGIIAAQSIGEPGTQLTMRTFHTGGIGQRTLVETDYRATNAGTIEIRDASEVPSKDEDGDDVLVALKRNGEIAVLDAKGRELEKTKVQYGAYIQVKPGQEVKKGQTLVKWDPHRVPILAEKAGKVRFEDIKLGETVRPEKEAGQSGGKSKKTTIPGESLVVIEHKGEMHPRIVIEAVVPASTASKSKSTEAPLSKEDIVDALLKYRRLNCAEPYCDIKNKKTREFFRENSFALCVAILCMGPVSDDKPYDFVMSMHDAFGGLDPTDLSNRTEEEIGAHVKMPVKWPAAWIKKFAAHIAQSYGGRVEKLWQGKAPGEIVDEVKKACSANPKEYSKIAALLPNLLYHNGVYKLPKPTDKRDLDAAVDVHVKRAMFKLKLIRDSNLSENKVAEEARKIHPEWPGELDMPLWMLGNELRDDPPQAYLEKLGLGDRKFEADVVGTGQILDFHYLPAKARIEVKEGDMIEAGHMLARQPREVKSSSDIVGGLPRVTEIFEARKPHDPAVLAEISGTVELRSDRRRGKMTIIIKTEGGIEDVEHHVPQDRHLLVHTGDIVTAGDPLTDGPLIPHDILRIKGEEALYTYLLDEVQNVYRAQGVTINDKHIEVIVGQMLRKIRVENPGDTGMLPNEVVDKFRFRLSTAQVDKIARIKEPGDTGLTLGQLYPKQEIRDANHKAEADGKLGAKATKARPATGRTLLLGITKASLQSESFLSGASFQETTKVLTEAALAAKTDPLEGLKENVLLGHLIPAGTGFKAYTRVRVLKLAEPVATETPTREEELAEAAKMAERSGAQRRAEIITTVGESRLVAALLGQEQNDQPPKE